MCFKIDRHTIKAFNNNEDTISVQGTWLITGGFGVAGFDLLACGGGERSALVRAPWLSANEVTRHGQHEAAGRKGRVHLITQSGVLN